MLRVILIISPNVADMSIPPCLESATSESNVGLLGSTVGSGDLAVVDDTLHLPLTVHVAPPGKRTIFLEIIMLVAGLTVTARLGRL